MDVLSAPVSMSWKMKAVWDKEQYREGERATDRPERKKARDHLPVFDSRFFPSPHLPNLPCTTIPNAHAPSFISVVFCLSFPSTTHQATDHFDIS
mmetsp:Transcript_30462/g.59864  ORF Transcript_30462/g.59864 Transcript_30462/m.59864 type:complete len:95 (-) Transcript_30462:275-559(-)